MLPSIACEGEFDAKPLGRLQGRRIRGFSEGERGGEAYVEVHFPHADGELRFDQALNSDSALHHVATAYEGQRSAPDVVERFPSINAPEAAYRPDVVHVLGRKRRGRGEFRLEIPLIEVLP